MQVNALPQHPLDLELAIDCHPMAVSSDTPLLAVLALMSRVRSSCVLPTWDAATEGYEGEEPGESLRLTGKRTLDVFPINVPQVRQTGGEVFDPPIASEGCVLVMEDSQLVGVFTERDIVRLTAAGTSLVNVKIADVVSKPAIALRQSEANDIFTALCLFRQHQIRHLPILDDNDCPVGIVTHNSIRRSLQPVHLLTRLRYVADVMARSVVHAPVTASVLELAQLMAQHRVSSVVITSAQKSPTQHFLLPVGIVTERDIVQFLALELDLSKTQAQTVMSTPLFCVSPSDSLWAAHQEMQRRHVRRLVVVGRQGELLGIVSQTSLLQVLNPADMYSVIEVLQQAVEERTGKLKESNERLRREIAERKRAEKALRKAHDDLKRQVEERTAELAKANAFLKKDILERTAAEKALRQSETQLRTQAAILQQALQELQKTQAQLIQTEKMSSLGQLVAGVAHEINNPINFIYGNLNYADQYIKDLLNLLQLYGQHYPQPVAEIQEQSETIDLEFLKIDLPKLLASMKVGAERIRNLVLSLRNFSRLDEAQMKAVNIHEGIDSTLLILQNQLEAKGGRFEIQVIKEYGNLPPVECLSGQLNQVFMNILSNAIDALNEAKGKGQQLASLLSPTIRIRTEVVGDNWVAIRIADNGLGMTEAVRNRLFDPFFTTKPVGKGTGLGLSISYQIVVEKHGGSLQCISAPGQGAELVIKIPISQKKKKPSWGLASA